MLTGKCHASEISNTNGKDFSNTHFYKLPYIGMFSKITQKRLKKLLRMCCTNIEIKFSGFFYFQNKAVVYCETF